jgi:hypothetical protein
MKPVAAIKNPKKLNSSDKKHEEKNESLKTIEKSDETLARYLDEKKSKPP